jgi:serine phosphatase RsbU (regulator of sigma subunit)
VGGDFFQILPVADGVLVVIGDVSGKGMAAAMTVSLLVGTVRTLAHYTQGPGEILAAMNARMIGRSNGGFTTCLVLRASSDGSLVVANAGHIAPFVGGKELELESGLPLGLASGIKYPEASFGFGADERLTLMTDGVIEARNATGELLGFDRLAALTAKPAVEIADAAQRWGQDDDITVLTLARVGA